MGSNFDVPYVEGLDEFMCAKYVRLLAKDLSGAEYFPANAWDFGVANEILVEVDGDLEDYESLMVPGKNVVIFYNPKSSHNELGRVGTHAGLYVGSCNDDIMIAEQWKRKQRVRSHEEMKSKGLKAKLIVGPRE